MRIKGLDNNHNILNYVIAIFEQQGRDFYTCEICGFKSKEKLGLFHLKYDNATINDIKIGCQKCNCREEYQLLK